jgi:protease PrsW
LLYFYLKDRAHHVSFATIMRVFGWGCVLTLPAAAIENLSGAGLIQDSLYRSAGSCFLVIAPVEEFFKLIAVWIAVYRGPDFREPLDGMLYSTTAALGFVSVENILYLALLGPEVLISRTFFATPAHAMYSSMWGYSMGLARFRRERELQTIFKGYFLSVVLHGSYDFLVAFHPKAAVITLPPLMIFMVWLAYLRIREFRRNHPYPAIGDGPLISCPSCGAYTLESAEACPRCGSKVPLLAADSPRYCGRCRALLDPCRPSCLRCGAPVALSRLCGPT